MSREPEHGVTLEWRDDPTLRVAEYRNHARPSEWVTVPYIAESSIKRASEEFYAVQQLWQKMHQECCGETEWERSEP